MAALFNPFSRSRAGDAWFSAGLAASFPNITSEDNDQIRELRPCKNEEKAVAGCKVFHVPKEDSSKAAEIILGESGPPPEAGGLKDQVLVFQYKGKFHAVNHECPHSSYPLSNGAPFDIEDFGIVWSAGITCPKHSWSFDLSSGRSDRGSYRLQVWEVEMRPADSKERKGDEVDPEVWVRRKQRMG